MTLDPHAKKYLEFVASLKPPVEQTGATEARTNYRYIRSLMATDPVEVAESRDLRIPGPHGPIPIRLYRPLGSKPGEKLPLFIYIHGGGWTVGDLDTHDALCRQFANKAACTVISVDYRLAPEHRFPVAIEDCWAALQWIAKNSADLAIDSDKIAIGGDSAGGNLAAVMTLMARDQGGPKLVYQVLIYPVTEMTMEAPSHKTNGQGFGLTFDAIVWFRGNYIQENQFRDWRASPLKAKDLSDLPPALVITAGCDPLVDEGDAYARRLRESGVPVVHARYEGQIHGFLPLGKMIPDAQKAVDQIASELRKRFY